MKHEKSFRHFIENFPIVLEVESADGLISCSPQRCKEALLLSTFGSATHYS